MTWKGVRPLIHLLNDVYERGVKLTEIEFRPFAERLLRSEKLPKWSLTIKSKTRWNFSYCLPKRDSDGPRNSHTDLNLVISPSQSLWGTGYGSVTTTEAFVPNIRFAISQTKAGGEDVTASGSFDFTEDIVIGSSAVVSTSLSVGTVIWALRGGSLLTAFLSAMPAWQAFDPLPVLQSFEKKRCRRR